MFRLYTDYKSNNNDEKKIKMCLDMDFTKTMTYGTRLGKNETDKTINSMCSGYIQNNNENCENICSDIDFTNIMTYGKQLEEMKTDKTMNCAQVIFTLQ